MHVPELSLCCRNNKLQDIFLQLGLFIRNILLTLEYHIQNK